jgi:hypothetical protein
MVKPPILSRALNGDQVSRLLDYANNRAIPPGILAKGARIGVGKVGTHTARVNLPPGLYDGLGQTVGVFFRAP